jgi:hypothetical protein
LIILWRIRKVRVRNSDLTVSFAGFFDALLDELKTILSDLLILLVDQMSESFHIVKPPDFIERYELGVPEQLD